MQRHVSQVYYQGCWVTYQIEIRLAFAACGLTDVGRVRWEENEMMMMLFLYSTEQTTVHAAVI